MPPKSQQTLYFSTRPQQLMQQVSEFMENCLHFAMRQQRRLSSTGGVKIAAKASAVGSKRPGDRHQ